MKRVIVGVALDISAQRAAQVRLKTAEARLHSALSSMTDSFVVWDSMSRNCVRCGQQWRFRAGVFSFLKEDRDENR